MRERHQKRLERGERKRERERGGKERKIEG